MESVFIFILIVALILLAIYGGYRLFAAGLFAVALSRGNTAPAIRTGGNDGKKWESDIDDKTREDARETAKKVLEIDIPINGTYQMFSPEEFEKLNVDNHRAKLGKSLEETFPIDDRPRGDGDIKSVRYHLNNASSPVVVLQTNGNYTLLDGVHRLVAAYITKSPIRALIVEGGAEPPTIQSRTAAIVDQFLTEQLTPEIAENAEILSSDIAHDIDAITLRKLESAGGERSSIQISKLALDTISHYFIYMKQPNSASRAGLENNIKILAGARKLGLADEKIGKLVDLCSSMLAAADKTAEVKISPASQRECFRRDKILTIIASTSRKTTEEISSLRDELSRKNMELRNKESSTESINLMNCNAERRALQEKIYDLRRDIDRYASSRVVSAVIDVASTADLSAARAKLEELRARNIALEEQLRRAHTSVQQDQAQCGACREELSNCKRVLDDVLGAN